MQKTTNDAHRSGHAAWLRAAVLGANDGILSTAGLLVGVAASNATPAQVLVTGAAGLTAGALSMAAGEYVSVSSQSDVERADLAIERRQLHEDPHAEHSELAEIYERRGLDAELAHRVAGQLMAHDALGAHARDELGISDHGRARPLLAAVTSASSYAAGAALPLITATLATGPNAALIISTASLLSLALLGAIAAKVGGAKPWVGAARVTFWGAIAMTVTGVVGHIFGASG